MISRSTNVRNSSWNLANILIYPIIFLAVTPFFINRLGEEVFGEWMLINSYVFIAVHILGFGLPHSITAHVAEALGHKDNERLNAYINVSSRLLGRMTLLTLLFALLIFVFTSFADLVFFSRDVWKTLVIATLFIAVKFPETLYQSIYKGYEEYDKAAVFNMTNRLLALGIQILLVIKGYGLFEIFIANLLINFMVVIWQAGSVYRKLTGYRPVLIRALPERKDIYHFGFWTWLQTIIAIASYQMDRFLIAAFLGTATVTYYVLATTIANHLHMAFEAVVSWFLPKISRLKASMQDTGRHFFTIRSFSVGFSLFVILGLYASSGPLFTLWLGPEKYDKMIDFFRLFLIFESFLILSIVPKLYLNAIKSLSFITALEGMYKSGIILAMIIIFSIEKTATSLIWGQILALLVFMPIEYFIVNRRVLKKNPLSESIMTMLPSLGMIGVITAGHWLAACISAIFVILTYYLVYVRSPLFDNKLLTE